MDLSAVSPDLVCSRGHTNKATCVRGAYLLLGIEPGVGGKEVTVSDIGKVETRVGIGVRRGRGV